MTGGLPRTYALMRECIGRLSTWWKKYKGGGFEALYPQSRKPKTIHKTPDKIVNRTIELRKETGWNEKAIAAKLKEEGGTVSHFTIYKYLSANGLINRLKRKRRKKTYRSWSRKHPNSLLADRPVHLQKAMALYVPR